MYCLKSSRLLCLFIVTILVLASSANAKRAMRDLASHEWDAAGYTSRVTIQEGEAGTNIILSVGLTKTSDGAFYVALKGGGVFHYLLRGEGKSPAVLTSVILMPKQKFDPSPWKAAKTVIAQREKLTAIAAEWDKGTEDEKAAATALRQLIDFRWEDKEFLVQCWTQLPPDLPGKELLDPDM
jgi:hypothetical protein